MWSKEEISRFKRQLLLPEMGEMGQLALKNAKILVVGAGGLGNVVCAYLAAAGVGRITIVDHDGVDISNLQRQVMFTQRDIGLPKARQLAMRLEALNNTCQYVPVISSINKSNGIQIFGSHDLVIDCVDQIDVRYLLNDLSVYRNIPLVYGAIHRFEGQVSVFNFKGSGTYRCVFPEKKDKNRVPNCEEIGVIGVLPGLVGLYQAMEVIKLITGMGKVLSNQILMIDLLKTTHSKFEFKRKEEAIQMAFNRIQDIAKKSVITKQRDLKAMDLEGFITRNPNLQIIDIQEELSKSHWGDIEVKHIPDYLFQEQIQEFDRKQTILVYCRKGVKSNWAIQVMDDLEFKDIYQLSGGISSVTD